MSSFNGEYESKRITYDALIDRFAPGTKIQLGVWYGEPYGVIDALNRLGKKRQPLYVYSNIHTAQCDFLDHPNAYCSSNFFGAVERASQKAHDNIYYVPFQFTEFLRSIRDACPYDYFAYRTTPMDNEGYFNCSLTASWEYYAMKWIAEHHPQTKIVIEVNRKLPYVHGLDKFGGNKIHISDIDLIVEDDADLFCFPTPEPTKIEEGIAANVAALIEDGATLQLGFGGVPMAVGKLLTEKRDLGIHTEMFCESHIDLIEAGAVTNAHKGLNDGISVATFALGGKRLHEWVGDNKAFAMLPVEEVNRVTVIAQLNKMTGVNAVLTIDLSGQACAHCLGPHTYSGLGGAFEFAYGCPLSPHGKSISCLPSTTKLKDGKVVSNIVPAHPIGTRITIPEHTIDWVVTEYGAVWLKYMNIDERAAALIDIAHPDFREGLSRQAIDKGIRLSKLKHLPRPAAHMYASAE